MNCINHPDVPVAAYCQNCGKALCQECVRSVGGVVYCESCLAARLNTPMGGVAPGVAFPPGSRQPYVGLPPMDGPNPGLALGLGFIPGVGAMYNGQFIKGLAHVAIFMLLCAAAAHQDFFGWLVAFWAVYQVFDAYQTAKARRDGTPIPNPFGLNDLGVKLGLQPHPEVPVTPPYTAPPAGPGASGTTAYTTGAPPYAPVAGAYDPYTPPVGGPVSGFVNPTDPVAGPSYGPVYPGQPQPYSPNALSSSGIPVGAIVLIGLGMLFLLGSMGIFRDEWIGKAWPLILVGIGVWLIVQRTRETQRHAPPNPPTGSQGGNPTGSQGGNVL